MATAWTCHSLSSPGQRDRFVTLPSQRQLFVPPPCDWEAVGHRPSRGRCRFGTWIDPGIQECEGVPSRRTPDNYRHAWGEMGAGCGVPDSAWPPRYRLIANGTSPPAWRRLG